MVVRIGFDGKGDLVFDGEGQFPIAVEVPEESEVLPTALLGPQLFVPVAPMQRAAYSATAVVSAARAGRSGFRFA